MDERTIPISSSYEGVAEWVWGAADGERSSTKRVEAGGSAVDCSIGGGAVQAKPTATGVPQSSALYFG